MTPSLIFHRAELAGQNEMKKRRPCKVGLYQVTRQPVVAAGNRWNN